MEFGKKLKSLRLRKGVGIKKLAREVGVSYTYISKLENNRSTPSSEFIERIATYFELDNDDLYISANKLPKDVEELIKNNPEKAISYLRDLFNEN